MATIVTFYSFKGGTGRSMALANVAWILASGGKRVLVVDWDLEAPGLHHYFRPFLPDADLLAMDVRGVIDFVFEYVAVAATPPAQSGDGRAAARPTDWYKPYADIRQCAIPLCWPTGEQVRFGQRGGIDFVPAGRQLPQVYAARVNGFNWTHFYEQQSGGAFMDAVRDSMQSYDYVLIDSRTGVSDTAGICTVQMPDLLVLCFTLNNQSIKGASAVAAQLAAAPNDKPVLPVPMRIDPFEKDKLNKRREYAHRVFGSTVDALSGRIGVDPARYWSDVEIPYFASYAYEELLAPFEKFSGSLGSMLPALEKLTGYISRNEVERFSAEISEARRVAIVAAYEQTGPAGSPSPPAPEQSGTKGAAGDLVARIDQTLERRRFRVVTTLILPAVLTLATAMGLYKVGISILTTRQQPVTDERSSAVAEAFRLRVANDIDGSVAALTRALDIERDPVVRAQVFRDRAFCYKLHEKWTSSIDDLSQALALDATSPAAITALNDRAFAYLKVTDLEAAIRDYQAVVSLAPGDAGARDNATVLLSVLKPTQPTPLFLFQPEGSVNDPRMIPESVLGLGYQKLNLRFWWHPFVNQVRYTDANDERSARAIVDRLRRAGFTLAAPVLTRALVTHDGRIEVWLNDRPEPVREPPPIRSRP